MLPMNRTRLRTAVLSGILAIAALVMMGTHIARAAGPDGASGSQRRWTLDFRVRLEQPGGERPMEIAVNGDWASTIVAVRSGEYDAALQVVNPRLKGGNDRSAPAGAGGQLEPRLARPFWATYSDDGA